MSTAGVPTWSTTAASNGSADPAVNWQEGMAPSAVNDSARAEMASVAKWRDDMYGTTSGLTTGGTSTAFTATTNSTYASAAAMAGAILTITPHTTSGAAPTLAVDGLTARALNVSTGVAVPTGALIAATPYEVRYIHATTEFIVLNPSIRPATNIDIVGATALTAPAVDDSFAIYDLSAAANKKISLSDHLKVINALTEDTSPDAAADFALTYDTSATAPKKVKLANMPSALPRGYISGCAVSNGTDTVNDLNIGAGVCRDATNTVDIIVPAITGKQLDANWAAGSAAGMRNSAAGIADGTYHIYAVRTAASATADIYAYAGVDGTDPDTSAAAATVLAALQAETGGASYAYARRIRSITRSTSIVQFAAFGNLVLYSTFRADQASTSVSSTASLLTVTVPAGVKCLAKMQANSPDADGDFIYVSSPNVTDEASAIANTANVIANSAGSRVPVEIDVMTNASRQVRARSNTAASLLTLNTKSYWDPLGQVA